MLSETTSVFDCRHNWLDLLLPFQSLRRWVVHLRSDRKKKRKEECSDRRAEVCRCWSDETDLVVHCFNAATAFFSQSIHKRLARCWHAHYGAFTRDTLTTEHSQETRSLRNIHKRHTHYGTFTRHTHYGTFTRVTLTTEHSQEARSLRNIHKRQAHYGTFTRDCQVW